jgi:hypothetical protein
MSKYSSFKSHQLIMENWRRFLAEEESLSPAAAAFIKGQDKGLEDYTTMLKQIASDPEFRKLAFAGRKDASGPGDETLTVSKGTPVAAKDLTPTQYDIDMEKSLGDQMKNRWDPPSTETALQKVVTMPSPGGQIPLLTYNNKYILDGHHRWSQVMMTNPEGMMTVSNLSGDALQDEEAALKAVQLAIAALAGNVETKDTKVNLLKFPAEAMAAYVRKNIAPEVLELLVKYKKISSPDVEEAVKYYVHNLAAIQAKPAGEFSRVGGMPQADESGTTQAAVDAALERGNINFDNPQPEDVVPRRRRDKK